MEIPWSSKSVTVLKKILLGTLALLISDGMPKPRFDVRTVTLDTRVRDVNLVKAQKRAQKTSKRMASKLVTKPSHGWSAFLRDTHFFSRQGNREGKTPLKLTLLGKLIAALFDHILLKVKRRCGVLVLEQRSTLHIAETCDLTIVTDIRTLYRSPSDDLVSLPKWVLSPVEKSCESIWVDITWLLREAGKNEQLRKQTEAVDDICGCLDVHGDGGGRLSGLRRSSRVKWNDPGDILRKIAPSSIVHAVRPTKMQNDDCIKWWSDRLNLDDREEDTETRWSLKMLLLQNPEELMRTIVNAVAIQRNGLSEQFKSTKFGVRISDKVAIGQTRKTSHRQDQFRTVVRKANGGDTWDESRIRKNVTADFARPENEDCAEEQLQNRILALNALLISDMLDANNRGDACVVITKFFIEQQLQFGKKKFRRIVNEVLKETNPAQRKAIVRLLDKSVPGWVQEPIIPEGPSL